MPDSGSIGGNTMKSEFLEEISKMDRDQIREILEEKKAKKRLICPVYFVNLPEEKKKKKKEKGNV